MITFSFDNRVWRVEFPSLNADFKVEFNVSDIDRIVEHETTVSDKTVINKLLESVSSEGFLHPVLVTEHRGVYVIADGTHRLFALRELALKKDCRIHVPLNILREPYFKRDSWVFYFNSRINLERIMEDGFTATEVDSKDVEKASDLVISGKIQALIKTGGKIYTVHRKVDDRYSFLKSLKELDNLLGDYNELVLREMFTSKPGEMAFLAPPIDRKGDIELLVENKNLRRRKASRTVVKLRPLFLDTPLQVLCEDYEDVKNFIMEKIENLIYNEKILLVKPPVTGLDFCNDAFDHPLLVMNKDIFYSKNNLKKKLENQLLEEYKII